jgi:hypothetical protein
MRLLPLDQPLESIVAVHGEHCWALRFYPTCAFSQPRSLICGSSIACVPLVGEGIHLHRVVVCNGLGGAVAPPWFACPPGANPSFRLSFPSAPLWRGRLAVRGDLAFVGGYRAASVMEGPLLVHGEGEKDGFPWLAASLFPPHSFPSSSSCKP